MANPVASSEIINIIITIIINIDIIAIWHSMKHRY